MSIFLPLAACCIDRDAYNPVKEAIATPHTNLGPQADTTTGKPQFQILDKKIVRQVFEAKQKEAA